MFYLLLSPHRNYIFANSTITHYQMNSEEVYHYKEMTFSNLSEVLKNALEESYLLMLHSKVCNLLNF